MTLPGVYDALTAKIAAQAGFKCLVMGGYSIAASRLGQPDVGYLTMTEMAQALKGICDAVDLPVRVQLRSTTGEIAEVAEFRTDLSPHPALDADGRLTFSFGGRLVLKGGESGSFRGNVPISAEYE